MSFPFKFNELKITRKVNLGNYESAEYGLSISPINVSNADTSIRESLISIDDELQETIKFIVSKKE